MVTSSWCAPSPRFCGPHTNACAYKMEGWIALLLLMSPLAGSVSAVADPQSSEDSATVQQPYRVLAEVRKKESRKKNASKKEDGGGSVDPSAGDRSRQTPTGVPKAQAKTTPGDEPPPGAPTSTVPMVPPSWTDAEIRTGLETCLKQLGPIIVEVEPVAPVKQGACGTPAPVSVRRIGAVAFEPPAVVNCAMVAKLAEWLEKTVQPAAREVLGSPVTKIASMSGYDCRFRNNALAGKLSEHAFANAIDIGAFVTAKGRRVVVLTDWGPTARDAVVADVADDSKTPNATEPKDPKSDSATNPGNAKKEEKSQKSRKKSGRTEASSEAAPLPDPVPVKSQSADRKSATITDSRKADASSATSKKGRRDKIEKPDVPPKAPDTPPEKVADTAGRVFLTRLHKGACGVFTTVLGPEANEAHRNHFHFDLATRRGRAYCQ